MQTIKALVTGGTSGLGKLLVERLGPESAGVGRGNGWDLRAPDAQEALAKLSLDFPVFVNYAYLRDFSQVNILSRVAELWKERKKPGLIVSFGSLHTYYPKFKVSGYSVHKAALDELCKQWAKEGEGGAVAFRVCNLKLGYLDLPKNIGKPHYLGYGINVDLIHSMIALAYSHPRFSFPEFVVNARPE